MKTRCMNLNHTRTNVPVRFCPGCGEVVNRSAAAKCDAQKHAVLLRGGHAFCTECGKKLGRNGLES